MSKPFVTLFSQVSFWADLMSNAPPVLRRPGDAGCLPEASPSGWDLGRQRPGRVDVEHRGVSGDAGEDVFVPFDDRFERGEGGNLTVSAQRDGRGCVSLER